MKRAYFHHSDKDYSTVSYIEYSTEDLNEIEAEFIIKYEPFYNLAMPTNRKYKSLPVICKIAGAEMWEVRKFIKSRRVRSVAQLGNVHYYKVSQFTDFLAGHRSGLAV